MSSAPVRSKREHDVAPPRREPGTYPVPQLIHQVIVLLGREGVPTSLGDAAFPFAARLLLALGVEPTVDAANKSPGAQAVRAIAAGLKPPAS